MAVILAAEKLGIGYPRHPVGRDLSLGIEAGTVTMLLGPNGCGKTTLFRTLMGLLPAQGGRVMLDGQPISTLGRNDIAKRIAYVPQVAQGYFPFTVLDVVMMGRAPYLSMFAQPGRTDREIAEAAMAEVGLADYRDRAFTAISGGQRQLALIARALAQAAPVLVMDEPTANLDYGNQHKVLTRAAALARDGRTVIVSTHNPDHALAFADNVVLMKAGAVLGAGAATDVLSGDALGEVYGIPVEIAAVTDADGRTRRVTLPKA